MIRFMRILLIVFAVGQLVLGLLLWLTPGFFFDEIGPYGAPQRPLHGDLATWYLALGAVALVAVRRASWRVPVLTLAFIQYALHSLNHLIDVGDVGSEVARPGELRVARCSPALLLGWMTTPRALGRSMRVFLAGASGAIGRPLVPKLVAAGHEVTGMTRSEERAEDDPRRRRRRGRGVDAFDADALRAAVAAAAPEVVIHQLTALPDRIDFRKKDLYDATNRLRTEGTRNLLDAAREAGARRFVSPEHRVRVPERRLAVKTEDDAAPGRRPRPFDERRHARSTRWRRMVLDADGLEGLVLRYGFFYGPGTYYGEDGSMAADVRRRRFPVVGNGTGLFSFVHVDDAADATVVAVERGAPGTYNVIDDEPGRR